MYKVYLRVGDGVESGKALYKTTTPFLSTAWDAFTHLIHHAKDYLTKFEGETIAISVTKDQKGIHFVPLRLEKVGQVAKLECVRTGQVWESTMTAENPFRFDGVVLTQKL